MTVEMTTAHYDETLETVLSASFCGIVFCAMWIIIILVDIEASRLTFFTVDAAGKDMDLQLDVTTEDANKNQNGMEVEPAPQDEPEIRAKRTRRVSFQFKMMQLGSVALLILLTYLLLVTSNASWWLASMGAISVFGMFLRFQIGDEIRRQRWDRLTLMMSLLLLVAAFLNLSTYAWKALAQGEIYMGPARILDYDMGAFNNSINGTVPTTRTNLVVQWGSDWACPFSGGKVCEADVQGVMCAVKPKPGGKRRNLLGNQVGGTQNTGSGNGNQGSGTHSGNGNQASSTQNTGNQASGTHNTGSSNNNQGTGTQNAGSGNGNQATQQTGSGNGPTNNNTNTNGPVHDGPNGNATHTGWGKNATNSNNDEAKLEKENHDLAKENEELKEEIEALKEKNDEEVDEMIDGEYAVEEEMLGEQLEEDKEIIDANEEKEEALADEDEMEEEMDKKEIQDELKTTKDDNVKEELEKEVDELDEEENETKADLDATLDADEEMVKEYQDFADEEYDAAMDNFDAEIDEMIDEEDTETDLDEIQDAIDKTEEQLNNDKNGTGSDGNNEAPEYQTETDDWSWNDMTFEYDDDMFENEYWNYDWDSVWGEYGCGDLFETEIAGQIHDPSIPAGPNDSWPYINIYGSCKYCDAYVLDYFAEEAFEKLDDYVLQGVMFMGLGFTGILISFVGFIKYKLDPPAENQIELLGSEAGVIA